MTCNHLRSSLALAGILTVSGVSHADSLPPADQIRAIAEEAMVYALPMVMDYAVLNEFSIDKAGKQYKGPLNQLVNEARVFTPADTTVVTPNSDTPYSFVWMDLRAEPMVICVPQVEKERYYSVQLVSQYTFNFGYIGSRATGNEAGCYGVVGPRWQGEKPSGISRMFTSGTDFAMAIFRTQLFDPQDIDKVKAVQAGYRAEPLSRFLGTKAPAAAPAIDWPAIDKDSAAKKPFAYLAFLLQFAPAIGPAEVEVPLRARFASIGIEAGKPFSMTGWTEAQKAALIDGAKAGKEKAVQAAHEAGHVVNGWRISEGLFGNRESLKDDYLTRAAAALGGIFGNDSAEALYPFTREDGSGQALDGSKAAYTITFDKGQLPPVHAFWSITMYDGKTQLLVANPIHRYLINSPMLPDMQRGKDGSLTLYVQHAEPSDPKMRANWLPAPAGPIYLVMRLYWPEQSALDGEWQPPKVTRLD